MAITWAISYYAAGSWTADGTIPAPRGQSFSDDIISSIEEITLADGSKAAVIPSVKYNKGTLKFFWQKMKGSSPGTLKYRLEAYITSGVGIRLTTHTGKLFEGYFTNLASEWVPGTSIEYYNITLDFMQKAVA